VKIQALLTGGFAAALAVAAFTAPPGPANAAAAPHSQPGSTSTRPLASADFATHAGGIAVGSVAGLVPVRDTGVSRPAPAVVSPAATCTEPNCNLPYHGGVVQHAPRVYLLFWGPKWNTDATHKAARNYLVNFYKGLGRTATDGWSVVETQYPDKTGRPKFGGSLLAGTHTIATAPPKSVTLNTLGNEAATAAQKIFKISLGNAHNAQIVIASQSGTCFQAAGGLTFAGNCGKAPTQSTTGYCAFHNFDFDPGNSKVFLPWVNLPFQPDAKAGCGQNFVPVKKNGNFEGFSVSGGHETAETITDPRETAWVDAKDTISGGEIADKCAWGGAAWNQNPADPAGPVTLSTGTFVMQSLWSNVQHRCVLTGKDGLKVTAIANQSTFLGKAVSLQVHATTTSVVPLTFKATGLPGGVHISKTGLISGTPDVTAGKFTVQVSVSYYAGKTGVTFTWKVASVPGPVTGFDAKCVDDSNGHTGNGTHIDLFTCNGKAQQKIIFTAGFQLQVLGKCVTGPLKAALEPCTLVKNQLWIRRANGEYVLKATGKCLTDPGSSKNDGTRLTLAACKNTASQHWSLP
jgi:hypothetical protein